MHSELLLLYVCCMLYADMSYICMLIYHMSADMLYVPSRPFASSVGIRKSVGCFNGLNFLKKTVN